MSQKTGPGTRSRATGPTIAFITTCKGRLHHLKHSLPLMLAQAPDEMIVVDYSCPHGTADWVEAEFPEVKVVRVLGQTGFNASRARNSGAAATTCDWLFFVDADVLMGPEIGIKLRGGLQPGNFYRPQFRKDKISAYGSFCCQARDFNAARGYDEVFEGWGHEDQDLYERLALMGVHQTFYSINLVDVVPHDDDERHILPEMQDRGQNQVANTCYGHAKRAISLQRGGFGNLPLAERQKLMQNVRQVIAPWYIAGAAEPLPVRFITRQFRPDKLSSDITIHSESSVTVLLRPTPPLMAEGRPRARKRPAVKG